MIGRSATATNGRRSASQGGCVWRWSLSLLIVNTLFALLSHLRNDLFLHDTTGHRRASSNIGNGESFLNQTGDGLEQSTETDWPGPHQTNTNNVKALVHRYMLQHSHQALERDLSGDTSNLTHRNFAIGYYSCPNQAGNRLHHFMNSIVWSIVTNRSLLFKYYDRNVCWLIGRRHDPRICRAANTIQDCDKVLKRASWLPSFDEWSPKVGFTSMKRLSYWTTWNKQTKHKWWKPGDEKHAGLADTLDWVRLVDFAPMLGQDAAILQHESTRNYLLKTSEARERARILLQKGPDYLYGLLFHKLFSFHSNIKIDDVERRVERNGPGPVNAASIVLHSRHQSSKDDGSQIEREKHCLEEVITNTELYATKSATTKTRCQVILLSDRPATLSRLESFLNGHFPHCVVKMTNHTQQQTHSFRDEHGPFAGQGFYQDLKLVVDTLAQPVGPNRHQSETRRQYFFIGSKQRSSSQLIRELVAYHVEESKGLENDNALKTCHYREGK